MSHNLESSLNTVRLIKLERRDKRDMTFFEEVTRVDIGHAQI